MRNALALLTSIFIFLVGCATGSSSPAISLSGDTVVRIDAHPENGFYFPYYLFVPSSISKSKTAHLLVEPNNTGRVSDDLAVHDQAARRLAEKSYPNAFAKKLHTPLLVPAFPRPSTEGEREDIYVHYLSRSTLESSDLKIKRPDLQLIAMIEDAQARLRKSGIPTEKKVWSFIRTDFSRNRKIPCR